MVWRSIRFVTGVVVKYYASHDAFIKQIDNESAHRQPEVMLLKKQHDFAEECH